jgi:hypothetical protein
MAKIPTKKEITETLSAIYKGNDGKQVDMTIKKAPKNRGHKILIGLIVFFGLIFAASWASILLFSRLGTGGTENIFLEVTGPKHAVAGEEAEFEVAYKNKDDSPLASAEIGLYLPKSFVLAETVPVMDEKNRLKLGSLEPGKGDTIKIKGRFFAAEGEKLIIQAILTYKPSNFNANFQKAATLETDIDSSVFDGSLDGPDRLSAGDKAVFMLNYKNKGKEDLENVAIDLSVPQDFSIATSSPAIGRNNRWEIGKLAAKDDGEIKITGFFGAEAKGGRDIILKLGVVDKDGALLTLVEKKITCDVAGGDLAASLMVNGATNFATVRWGGVLAYSITYKNDGKDTLYDVKFKTNISGLPKERGESIVAWATLVDPAGGARSGEDIIWTKREIPGLAAIKPGEGGTIDFSINIIKKPVNPSYRDYKVETTLEAEIGRIGNMASSRKIIGGKVTAFVDSDADFKSQARYYDDSNAPVGSGPVPPKVGQKTTYRIYWSVSNSMHELENIVVSGDLPESVVFGNAKSDAGEIALDSSLKKVQWTLNRMPASVTSLAGQFDLTLTPAAKDVGNVMDLLNAVTFTARDKSTGGIITISGGDETTVLADDPFITSVNAGRAQN